MMCISVALPRYTMVDFDLGNGHVVPSGYKVAIDMHAVHFNPDIYPDPRRCDLFRFSKLREADSTDSKYGFATVDSHVSHKLFLPTSINICADISPSICLSERAS
jgi:cytochrome P450